FLTSITQQIPDIDPWCRKCFNILLKYRTLKLVVELCDHNNPESYANGRVATGRVKVLAKEESFRMVQLAEEFPM
ncbi:hypothetical protein L9F63_014197, partial [Diploptera punctata]